MSLAQAARTLAANYLGAQYASPEEKIRNGERALELDVIAARLEQKEKFDASIQDG